MMHLLLSRLLRGVPIRANLSITFARALPEVCVLLVVRIASQESAAPGFSPVNQGSVWASCNSAE